MVKPDAMVCVEDLGLQAGEFRLRNVSFTIAPGEYFILLGPTGCGKTLLVETICGLSTPENGSIYISGREVTTTDPAQRRIGYVPQDYALLPFKTVEQNIAFGLEAHKTSSKEIKKRLDAIFEMLDIGHLRKRFPARLSGGERQRVALGRALAINPGVLVMDEPLSALDESTCKELMDRLKELHSQLNTTFIHICHRVEEALTLGDTLAIMRNGQIEQSGAPGEIFSRPKNLFVADFLQLPNLTKGEVKATSDGNVFHINGAPVAETQVPQGSAYGVIPLDSLTVSTHHPGEDDGYVVLTERIAYNSTGPHEPGLRFDGELDFLLPGIFPKNQWPVGEHVYIKFPRSAIQLLRE